MRPCEVCGAELGRKQRRFCSRRCCGLWCGPRARAARSDGPYGPYAKSRERWEDLQVLIQAGESPWQIPARLGTTHEALGRWLYRNGHRNLATSFACIAKRQRKAA